MSTLDLKGSNPGDLVKDQRLSGHPTYGTFQGWDVPDDGQTRLIVRHLEPDTTL